MIVRNEDIKEVLIEVPEGHTHLRTTLVLNDGTEMVFQEAAISNILRAFVTVKTHPLKESVRLTGRRLEEKKNGYAEWQMLEEE